MIAYDSPNLASRYDKIPVECFRDSFEAAKVVAFDIASLIRIKQALGKTFVLGLATGSTPISVYEELIRLHQHEGLCFKNVVTFNVDEYYPIERDALLSDMRFVT